MEIIVKNIILVLELVEYVLFILGKKYKVIKFFEYWLFGIRGGIVLFLIDKLNYIEVFVGSGEFVIVLLIFNIYLVKFNLLIFFDELEVLFYSGV